MVIVICFVTMFNFNILGNEIYKLAMAFALLIYSHGHEINGLINLPLQIFVEL